MSISNLGKTSSAFDKLFSAFSSGNYADFESASNSILSVSIETIAAVAKTKNLTAAQTALALATRGASKEQIAQNLALRGFSKEIVSKTMSNTLGYSDEMIEAAFAADSVASAFGKVGESGSAAVTKIGDVFSGLGGILKKSLPLLAAISIAIGAIKLTDWAITTPEEANENMATQFSEYEAANSEVESLNSELETTNVRIKELQAKGGLTLLENGELENLKEAATLLKVQKDLAERKAESEGREAAESALDAYPIL